MFASLRWPCRDTAAAATPRKPTSHENVCLGGPTPCLTEGKQANSTCSFSAGLILCYCEVLGGHSSTLHDQINLQRPTPEMSRLGLVCSPIPLEDLY